MALADSGRAIGAVTKLLSDHLTRRHFSVVVGKPEDAALNNTTHRKLNLFLYETSFDGSLRNVSLEREQPPPLWLTLKYLVTAFDASEKSDSAAAHELLGESMSALHELNYLSLDASVATDVRRALENSPEPLKITFEDTSPELLSKIMQGTDEKYRLSVAFQVRPVMIVPNDPPPSLSLLVGVDYTAMPPAVIGQEGVGLAVLASLGPRLGSLAPSRFEPGDEFSVRGEDLHLSNLECLLGDAALSIIGQRPDRLTVRAEGVVLPGLSEGPVAAGGVISAGEHVLVVRQLMPNGRYRSSNLLTARLVPVLNNVTVAAGTLTLHGVLLGTWDDDVVVALYRDGKLARLFEPNAPPPAPVANGTVVPGAGQKSLTIAGFASGLAAGEYRVMVRVNGQQARLSPAVTVP